MGKTILINSAFLSAINFRVPYFDEFYSDLMLKWTPVSKAYPKGYSPLLKWNVD